MKEETRILELLSEVLQNQDKQSKEQADFRGSVERRFDAVDARMDRIVETQLAHHQILKALATNQQNSQKTLERMADLLDTVTRMQRDQNRRLDRLENPDMAA